ncbi:MAG TPA: CBS domain-containing protein [Longimicrobiales bacterium]|nr:CBS domain-containing protein [Longimicrobiales bacterium]
MSAGRICSRVVATASPSESVRLAAQRMTEHNVGTLVVLNGQGKVVGILTDRDVMTRCVAPELDPSTTSVGDVMSESPRTVHESTPIEEVLDRMASTGVRRLVVTGDSADMIVEGVISLDDVIELLVEEATAIGKILEKEEPRLNAAKA